MNTIQKLLLLALVAAAGCCSTFFAADQDVHKKTSPKSKTTPNSAGLKLVLAAKRGDYRTVEKLLRANPDIVNTATHKGDTALMQAMKLKNPQKIATLLLNCNADPNIQDAQGVTALFMATDYSDLEMVEQLCTFGARDMPNLHGTTALMRASKKGCRGIVQELLAQKTNTKKFVNDDGETAFSIAEEVGYLNIAHLLKGLPTDDNRSDENQDSNSQDDDYTPDAQSYRSATPPVKLNKRALEALIKKSNHDHFALKRALENLDLDENKRKPLVKNLLNFAITNKKWDAVDLLVSMHKAVITDDHYLRELEEITSLDNKNHDHFISLLALGTQNQQDLWLDKLIDHKKALGRKADCEKKEAEQRKQELEKTLETERLAKAQKIEEEKRKQQEIKEQLKAARIAGILAQERAPQAKKQYSPHRKHKAGNHSLHAVSAPTTPRDAKDKNFLLRTHSPCAQQGLDLSSAIIKKIAMSPSPTEQALQAKQRTQQECGGQPNSVIAAHSVVVPVRNHHGKFIELNKHTIFDNPNLRATFPSDWNPETIQDNIWTALHNVSPESVKNDPDDYTYSMVGTCNTTRIKIIFRRWNNKIVGAYLQN